VKILTIQDCSINQARSDNDLPCMVGVELCKTMASINKTVSVLIRQSIADFRISKQKLVPPLIKILSSEVVINLTVPIIITIIRMNFNQIIIIKQHSSIEEVTVWVVSQKVMQMLACKKISPMQS